MSIIHPIEIGGVRLAHNIVLAPMAGVSDLPFRVICSGMGAGMTCCEMVSAKAVLYNNKKTYTLAETDDRENVTSVQLFGHDPECIGEAITRFESLGLNYDILDINMGCPVHKVVSNGDGSALMKDPALAGRIVRAAVTASTKPVTVKIRTGFDEEHINAVEVARTAEVAGAAAITVHGRTRSQFYSGTANWDIIARVKQAVTIPVIGNGDITTLRDIVRMQEVTGVDGYMIGRAARGNPWIFEGILREAARYGGADNASGPDDTYDLVPVSNPTEYKPETSEIIEMILSHAKLLIDYKGEYIGIREMRKHTAWYTAGLRGASELRGRINDVESLEELATLLNDFDLSNV